MKIFGLNKKSNSQKIYFYNSEKKDIKINLVFDISIEEEKLRVKNQNINYLFSNLDLKKFDLAYNRFFKHLNLDFSELIIGNKSFELSEKQQESLTQEIITNWIYFYSVNSLKIEVKESDFKHPFMIDYLLRILDKKYGIDTNESLQLGARILRQDYETYISSVKGRRRYYEK